MNKAIQELQKQLATASKGTHVSILSESEIASVKEYFPTPSYDLNRILTGSLFKGLASKTFTLITGPEASFKSSFMSLCAAEASRRGYMPIILDTEGAYTNEFISRWGMNPDEALYIYEPIIEKIFPIVGQLIANGNKKLCIILDSIGGLESMKLIDDAEDGDVKADQGGLAKKIKRLLKLLLRVCKLQDSLLLASAHLYGNPSGYGESEIIGGGKFVKYAPDVIIALKKSKMQDKEKNVIGNELKAITTKNRLYKPFEEAIVQIDYINGINRYAGLLDLAMKAGFIERGGAWYTNKITGEKFQGEANVIKCFTEDMLKTIDEWVRKTGYSNINTEEAGKVDSSLKEDIELEDDAHEDASMAYLDIEKEIDAIGTRSLFKK